MDFNQEPVRSFTGFVLQPTQQEQSYNNHGAGRRGSHQRVPSSSLCIATNETIESAGEFEDDDDDDEESYKQDNEKDSHGE